MNKFTDRFIKLPVKIFDRKMQELTGKSEDEESFIMINPFEIFKYRPTWDNDDTSQNEITAIVDKTGEVTLVYLTVKEFEELLNKSQQ